MLDKTLITSVFATHPDQTVEAALDVMQAHHIRVMPVLDAERNFIGLFRFHDVLEALLPVSARIKDGLTSLGFTGATAPGAAKKLRHIQERLVSDFTVPSPVILHHNMSTWEVIRLLVAHGGPLPVVDEQSGVFVGLVSEKSLLDELEALIKRLEAEGEFEDNAQ